ncbi:MAG: DUF1269 domain-containing protein [Acidobacteria bacterium]|nr:MAG: DUF1269 domain-containing protein [Acidobacteriota bacterium]
MDKMLVTVFDNESKAYEGSRILKELDAEGSIGLYATAVVAKDAGGKVNVKQATNEGPLGTAAGLFAGSLLGLLGGPVGLAVGAGVGTLGGVLYDLARVGVSDDFLAEVERQLQPGKAAVVAEAWEEWVTPVDTRIEAAGGTVLRRAREEVVDAKLERETASLKAEIAALKAEHAQATKEHKAKLEAKLEVAKGKLRATQNRVKATLAAVTAEYEAKIKALQAKATKARGDAKAKLEARISEDQARSRRCSEKLHQAWELAKQALEE